MADDPRVPAHLLDVAMSSPAAQRVAHRLAGRAAFAYDTELRNLRTDIAAILADVLACARGEQRTIDLTEPRPQVRHR